MKEYFGQCGFICTDYVCTRYWTFSGWEWSPSVGGLITVIHVFSVQQVE